MEKKTNQKLTIIVGALLVVIGISFAYFMASLLIEGDGASTKGTTAVISGATLRVDGTLEFGDIEDNDILPGHKSVSAVKVTATGNNQLIAYNLIWSGTNGISQINYTVYKSSQPKTLSTNCTPTTKVEGGVQQLSETCTISNLSSLGDAIASGEIIKNDTKEVLVDGEFITATSDGQSVYYYVVLEYPNLEIDQSGDIEATFEGVVSVEESDKEADINILAVYVAEEGSYQEKFDIPGKNDGYRFTRAECSNEATATWDNVRWGLITTNLTKSGTSCNLYFDKGTLSEQTLANLGIYTTPTDIGTTFTSVEIGSGGLYSTPDPTYGGTTYYYRGAVTNNYVVFAGKCWRIIRINGNGSIRMIFDSSTTTCKPNGQGENATASQAYNSKIDDNAYVGYMKGLNDIGTSESYAAAHANTYNSDIKTYLDNWYTSNIDISNGSGKKYSNYIDEEAGFCNDRNLVNTSGTGIGTTATNYAAYDRIEKTPTNATPTMGCTRSDDLFTPSTSSVGNKILGIDSGTIKSRPIGLITADEVIFAGALYGQTNGKNQSYYLYNGTAYWTMSPYCFSGSGGIVFRVDFNGSLFYAGVDWTGGSVRPVINLKSTTTFSTNSTGEIGTINNPYVVE